MGPGPADRPCSPAPGDERTGEGADVIRVDITVPVVAYETSYVILHPGNEVPDAIPANMRDREVRAAIKRAASVPSGRAEQAPLAS